MTLTLTLTSVEKFKFQFFCTIWVVILILNQKNSTKHVFLSNLNNLSPQSSFIAIITIKGVGLHNNCIQKKIFRIDEKKVHRMKGR